MAVERRRAQLRYREKQRQQRDDDRRTIEELSARVAALETQSAELARRNQLLTSVAAIKEAQTPVQPQPANAAVRRAAWGVVSPDWLAYRQSTVSVLWAPSFLRVARMSTADAACCAACRCCIPVLHNVASSPQPSVRHATGCPLSHMQHELLRSTAHTLFVPPDTRI